MVELTFPSEDDDPTARFKPWFWGGYW